MNANVKIAIVGAVCSFALVYGAIHTANHVVQPDPIAVRNARLGNTDGWTADSATKVPLAERVKQQPVSATCASDVSGNYKCSSPTVEIVCKNDPIYGRVNCYGESK